MSSPITSAPTNHSPSRRITTGRKCVVTFVAALLALSLATVSCGTNTDGITRANISDLPTPTGGEIFASADEVATTESMPENQLQDDAALFEGGAGIEGTIIEDVVAQNPEVAELIQKVRRGTATDADLERLNTLLNEAFAQGGPLDLGASPTAGLIHAVHGDSVDIQPDPDEQGVTPPTATIIINEQSQILVASESTLGDMEINDEVDVIALRGEDGIIRARTVTVADIDEATLGADGTDAAGALAFGRRSPLGRLLRGTGLTAPPGGRALTPAVIQGAAPGQRETGRAPGARFASRQGANLQPATDDTQPTNGLNQLFDDAEGIPAQGRVTKIEDARLHIETEQGPLRATIDDQTEFVRIASGTSTDITEGLSAFAIADPDGIAIMILVGPGHLLDTQEAGLSINGP